MKLVQLARRRLAVEMAASGTPVTLRWNAYVGTTTDPVTGARVGGTRTSYERTIKAFVHFVSAATTERRFAEVETGDVILDIGWSEDFLPGAGGTGYGVMTDEFGVPMTDEFGVPMGFPDDPLTCDGLRFVIDGEEYVPKAVGGRLAKHWDVLVQGVKLYRTILLRKAT